MNENALNNLNKIAESLKTSVVPLSKLPVKNLDLSVKVLSESNKTTQKAIKEQNKAIKKSSQIAKDNKSVTKELITETKENSKLLETSINSNTDLIKKVTEGQNTALVIGSSVNSGLTRFINEYVENAKTSNESLEMQRNNFANFQKELQLRYNQTDKMINSLLNIESQNLDFSQDSQNGMNNIFKAIQSDLNSEKMNTTLANIESNMDVAYMLNEKILKSLEDNATIRQDLENEKRRKREENKEKDTDFTKNLLEIATNVLGLGNIMPFIVESGRLLGSGVQSLFNFIKSLPSLTARVFTTLQGLGSKVLTSLDTALNWVKGLGTKGLDVGKKVIEKGANFITKGFNWVKSFLKSPAGKVGAKAVGMGAGVATSLLDASEGFNKTEQIMNKDGQEFGTLDIINAGGVNAITFGGLIADPSKVQKQIEKSFDVFFNTQQDLEGDSEQKPVNGKEKTSSTMSTGDLSKLGNPLEKMTVTSPFGLRTHPVTGEPMKSHKGVDLAGTSADSIYSPFDGKVTYAGNAGNAGNLTIISHGNGLISKFMHQSSIAVKQNQLVKTGQKIGNVGATGRVTGSHLHWETWLNGKPVDPMTLKYNYTGSPSDNATTGKGGKGGDNLTQSDIEYMKSQEKGSNYFDVESLQNITSGIGTASDITQKITNITSYIPNLSNLPIIGNIEKLTGILNNSKGFSSSLESIKDNFNISGITNIMGSLGNLLGNEGLNNIINSASGFVNNFTGTIQGIASNLPEPIQNLIPKDFNDIQNIGTKLTRTLEEVAFIGDMFKTKPSSGLSSSINQQTSLSSPFSTKSEIEVIKDFKGIDKQYLFDSNNTRNNNQQTQTIMPIPIPTEKQSNIQKSMDINDYALAFVVGGFLD